MSCAVNFFKVIIISSILTKCMAENKVLDPALYLAPSPPLRLTSDSVPPGEMWTRGIEARTERVVRDVLPVSELVETTQKPIAAESGRMFWPRFSQPQPVGINIPLSFSLSGTYGKLALPIRTGVIGNTYTSVTNPSLFGKATASSVVFGGYGKSALAGSSYGSYGLGSSVRIYGGDNVPAWSGWGNGKWGHYGKG